jgi:hypothetical protein
VTNTGPPRASGGQHAPTPPWGELAANTIPQAGQASGPPPGAAPGQEGPPVPRPAAAPIDIALLTGPCLMMGRAAGRRYRGRTSAGAAFGVWRGGAPSGGQGQATWA